MCPLFIPRKRVIYLNINSFSVRNDDKVNKKRLSVEDSCVEFMRENIYFHFCVNSSER